MVVGTATRGCQVAVIGAGPGGYLAAIRLAQIGKDVLLIEENDSLGGICLNEGCIPSKALIHATDFLEEARSAGQMGLSFEKVTLDIGKLVKWKDRIVRQLTGGVRFLVTKNGGEVLKGRARFVSERRLEVVTDSGPVLVEFEQAVIATGSRQMELPGFDFDGNVVMGAREALSPANVPERLVIIGGGYIGLEMGSMYRRLGSIVDLVEVSDTLLPFHDSEVRTAIAQRMRKIGVTLHLGHSAIRLEKGSPSRVIIRDNSGGESTLETDRILVSIGRKPLSSGIGVESIGVEMDSGGFIVVNDRMETNIPGIYALGDVVGGPLLAHKAYREAKVAADVIGGNPAAFDNVVIPAVVYTDPELAWAGLTETEAVEAGHKIVTGVFPFRASGRAMTLSAVEGFVKTIADADSKLILGVVIMGRDAGELISEAALAIEMGAFLDDLAGTIHPHPTMSEGLLESVEAALGEAVHVLNRDQSSA
ncbi:dihydrolipoyl dehydrogenase [bacterium]|nr:dihydrolipoyl dehydrogenase [candidate division CSSED10-310 bacterium]